MKVSQLFLNAKPVAKLLGVSPSSSYELIHKPDFPMLGRHWAEGRQQDGGAKRRIRGVATAVHSGRCGLRYKPWPKCDPDYFQLSNEVFLLGLSPGALAVYLYLLCCENRKTYPY